MKPLFLTICSLLAFTSFAQNLELGINYGIGYNSTIKNTAPNTAILLSGPTPIANAPAYSLKGMYTYRKWQFGIAADYGSSTYKWVNEQFACVLYCFPPDMTAQQFTQYMKYLSEISYKTVVTSPYIPIKLFTNRKIITSRFENYGGVSAGYVFLPNVQYALLRDRNPFNKNGYYGLTAGMQAGSTYFITKRFGVNAEVDADYIKFNQGAFATSRTYTYPVTLGIRYKL